MIAIPLPEAIAPAKTNATGTYDKNDEGVWDKKSDSKPTIDKHRPTSKVDSPALWMMIFGGGDECFILTAWQVIVTVVVRVILANQFFDIVNRSIKNNTRIHGSIGIKN